MGSLTCLNKYCIQTCRVYLSALILAVLLSACTSSPDNSKPGASTSRTKIKNQGIENQLRNKVSEWYGTPHRMGGTGKSGIDCSGFVMRIYRDTFGMRLPRTTTAQRQIGRSIDPRHLRAGDLVFFQISSNKGHVGIYLSKGEFAHTSYRQGVTISRLDNTYWRKVFRNARRIL